MNNFFANLLSVVALLFSFSSFGEDKTAEVGDININYIKASQYKFNTFINGVPLGEVDTVLALGMPASITYQDKDGNPTYRVKLLANEYIEGSSHPMVTHVIQQNVSGSWVELIQTDIAYEESKEGNITLLNKDLVEVSIKGLAKFTPVDKKQVESLSSQQCDDSQSVIEKSASKVITSDCCGGSCGGGVYYRCCGAVKCCVCGGGCCTTRK